MYNYRAVDPIKCEFIPIGPDSDLPDGKRIFVEIDGLPIVVFRVGGTLYAIADMCSHDDGPLGEGELEGYEVVCPRHGARFSIQTGKALALPAIVDIAAYPTRVVNDEIEVGIPIEF